MKATKKKLVIFFSLFLFIVSTFGLFKFMNFLIIPEKKMGNLMSQLLIVKNLKNLEKDKKNEIITMILKENSILPMQYKISIKYYFNRLKTLETIYKDIQDASFLNQAFFNKLKHEDKA